MSSADPQGHFNAPQVLKPPINAGEVYVRCPECGLIGWTIDDPTQPPPPCPECEIPAEIVRDIDEASGRWDVRIIDGEPVDPTHHLTGKEF